MKNRIIFFIIMSLLLAIYTGCKEEGRIDHIDNSYPAPAQVTDVRIRNTAGGAVLKYNTPTDENLLYVRAEYEIHPGVVRETKSSYYKDSLVLEGFGDTRTYEVKLYSVGKNEKVSKPVTVRVSPETAPVHLAAKQLKNAFGGVTVSVENPEKAALAIVLMGDTAKTGYQNILETFYTSLEKASFTLRGLDTISADYSVCLRDRWNNFSDTATAILTPMFEEEIQKPWSEYYMINDPAPFMGSLAVRTLWNKNFTDGMSCYISDLAPLPSTFTWDIGKTIMISRIKMWPRAHIDDRWIRHQPKIFELYGSKEEPDPDGSLDKWIPLGRFECVKPSPGTAVTQEDIAAAMAGIDFEIEENEFAPQPFVPVRWLRFRIIQTYASSVASHVAIQELGIWGTYIKD